MKQFDEMKIIKNITKGLSIAEKGEIPNVELLQSLNELGGYSFFEQNISDYPANYYDLIKMCYKPFSEWKMIKNKKIQDEKLLNNKGKLTDFANCLIDK